MAGLGGGARATVPNVDGVEMAGKGDSTSESGANGSTAGWVVAIGVLQRTWKGGRLGGWLFLAVCLGSDMLAHH